jgi:type I restriction-modification system DNA methylase subunit/predicted type IV restriction endonuclease
MGAPDTIKRLVDSFKRNEEYYINGSINETQLRREFLDPFFAALGWDVENKAGYADAYKDVIHEYSLKTKDVREAPDYCFRIGGTRKFFVEAKKPSVNVKDDIHPAFQLRSYAWSAKLPLSVLTDFEEFAVYDCRIPPNKKDKASNARIMFITYDQYIEKWDEIEDIFSREAILKGSFDKYVESNKKKKGTAEVDLVFLEQMETWRKSLAKNIALRNPSLSIRELNYSVQKTIDRIIFLRICEDRGIEDYGQLMALQNGTSVYERLKQIFYRADEKYNSGLFHFENERDRTEPPDNLTLDLTIDDKTIKEIVKELYYPESPYEFSVLPADILGQVYEQFLGKVIRLTAGHQAVIEDKPEVKKAGGVYYTPTYIVDYIVNNTIGNLLNVIPGEATESDTQDRLLKSHAELVSASQLINKIPKQVRDDGFQTPKEVSTLKILDPACGSGSFLLGAYQYLLDWHLKFYLTELETSNKLLQQKHPPVYINDKGDYLLTTSEKKRILLNNIYGVDIDPQAVEVTKLSLMLKVLEGESTQTLSNELQFFRERALPDLSNNIKCGNSLIGPDFYDQMEMNFIDDEEKLRINVFDWNVEFKEIMNKGGFDVVIGNPPYGSYFQDSTLDYLKQTYVTFVGRGEIYMLFCEKALSIIKDCGLFGYIVPDTYLNLGFTKALRELVINNSIIREIVRLPSKVFKSVSVDTTLLFTQKKPKEFIFKDHKVILKLFNKKSIIDSLNDPDKLLQVYWSDFSSTDSFNIQTTSIESSLLRKLETISRPLNEFVEMFSGIKVYEVGKGVPPQSNKIRDDKPYTSNKSEGKDWSPFFEGKDIERYKLTWANNNWLKYGKWLAAPREPANFIGDKILIRKIIGKTLLSTFVSGESYCNTLLFILKIREQAPIEYLPLLGILNSQLISWYYRKKFQISDEDIFPQIMIRDILQFPIPVISKSISDKLSQNVNLILESNKKIVKLKTPTERTAIERQIQATDTQIDQLVYQLYGLTEEEIKIVESTTSSPK